MKNLEISKLYFWTWYLNFAKLTDQSHLFKDNLLADKLKQYLFFFKIEADVSPSYNFWGLVSACILNLSADADSEWHPHIEKAFLENPEAFLKDKVLFCLAFWRYFPQIFRDFWIFYPKYGVPFDTIECVYLDYWKELPKVIDSLLSELLVRDAPIRDKIPADPFQIELSRIATALMTFDIYPPVVEEQFTEEGFCTHMIAYLSGEDSEKVFLQVINFYLTSRPIIKNACISALKAKGLSITEESLARNFLGEYIFKGVSQEAKRFFIANADLKEKNTFKKAREFQIREWNSYSKEEHEEIITERKNTLKYMAERVAHAKTLTLEDRKRRQEEGIRRLNAVDFESLPKVSLSALMALGGDSSPRK